MWTYGLISVLLLTSVESARILAVFPFPSLSHHLYYRPILTELSKSHQVISVTPDPLNDPRYENLTEIDVREVAYGAIDLGYELAEYAKATSHLWFIHSRLPILTNLTESILKEPKVEALKTQQFDLLLTEFLMGTATQGYSKVFNCPWIGIASLDIYLNGYDAVGSPINPSYYVDWLKPSGKLSFPQRIKNFVYATVYRVYYRYIWIRWQEALTGKYFGEPMDLLEIESTVSLVILNTNPIFHRAKPMPPAVIPVNGLHIKPPRKLPKDLRRFLDEGEEGVIYLSFGSNIKSSFMTDQMFADFLEACRSLPYKFIWKSENQELLSEAPDNVYSQKWLPQQDLLRHPNIRLFITQGGLQSVEEAIHAKVPLLAIPFGSDQFSNAERIVELGIGKKILLGDITYETLVGNVTELMTNDKYLDKIEEISDLIWDQPSEPLDRAIWWIEYVLRHKGAKHLRSPTADIPFLIQMNVDIFLTILVLGSLNLLFWYYALKFMLSFKGSKKQKKKKL